MPRSSVVLIRVCPPELVFDRGLGDLFVIRTAGQVIDNAVLGSLEFGVAELNIPLLMVLGHEKCGAVKATIEAVEQNATAPAHIGALVEGIRPAVEKVKGQAGDALDNAVREKCDASRCTVTEIRDHGRGDRKRHAKNCRWPL